MTNIVTGVQLNHDETLALIGLVLAAAPHESMVKAIETAEYASELFEKLTVKDIIMLIQKLMAHHQFLHTTEPSLQVPCDN